MKQPYIIYEGTIFLHKIPGGYELVPSYDGTLRNMELPETEVIKNAIKRAGKPFPQKKDRFCLITFDGRTYQAFPGWGIIAGNLNLKKMTPELLQTVLNGDRVEAIAYVSENDDVEFITQEDLEQMKCNHSSGSQSE